MGTSKSFLIAAISAVVIIGLSLIVLALFFVWIFCNKGRTSRRSSFRLPEEEEPIRNNDLPEQTAKGDFGEPKPGFETEPKLTKETRIENLREERDSADPSEEPSALRYTAPDLSPSPLKRGGAKRDTLRRPAGLVKHQFRVSFKAKGVDDDGAVAKLVAYIKSDSSSVLDVSSAT
ncbi:uncharacterized protein LOC135208269 [Macrobrachium nipponense]|uniref:uncharacterized protein LOC135208269 n=1 Tax=Macrobrachium nipponense TaxID=159736 RepID=UPI0030C7AA8D